MDLINKAFIELYPEKEYLYNSTVKYSKAFSPYNANVRYTKLTFNFKLSHLWKGVSEEIKIGLIQYLLSRIFKSKHKTVNMDLYNMFLKNVHISIPKTNVDPILKESFDRVNEIYLNGMLEMPNLIWGNTNFSRLGTYEYGSDNITISKILIKDQNFLDYVMYHECLHKKLKFKHSGTRSLHHSKEFREKEKLYEDKDVENKLKLFLLKERRKKWSWF